jgi:hypothetical protein
MGSGTPNARKHSFTRKFKVWGIVALCGILLCLLLAALGQLIPIDQKLSVPSPPDLSRCTHLEIQCHPQIVRWFSFFENDPNFLSASEMEYLQSLEKLVIDDKKNIEALALQLNSGIYEGVVGLERPIPLKYFLSIVFYRNDERIASIDMYDSDFIVTENGNKFDYDRGLPDLLSLAQQIRPLMLRRLCGLNLWLLYDELTWFSKSVKSYPFRMAWCEMIVRNSIVRKRLDSDIISEEQMMAVFKCPSAGEGKCHYALNPNCKPDSPPDTVLLFETKAGWNQHGGPELFTFDNHDPKGGCVLLNDGTVKFIRTKEELQQLRWK